jgi:GR25 family glycosyltransferase involved in LPS biosynthesis
MMQNQQGQMQQNMHTGAVSQLNHDMQTPQHIITHVNQCRQLAQQMIQQTQQSNYQYQQMLHNEQQNVQILEQMLQRERIAVQTIQQSLQGHEIAMQRCQEVIANCNRMEQELSGQIGMYNFQSITPEFQSQMFQGNMQANQYRQQ